MHAGYAAADMPMSPIPELLKVWGWAWPGSVTVFVVAQKKYAKCAQKGKRKRKERREKGEFHNQVCYSSIGCKCSLTLAKQGPWRICSIILPYLFAELS